MIVHLGIYRHLIPDIKTFYEMNKYLDDDHKIAITAIVFGCPIVCIIKFLMEEYGTWPWAEYKIEMLKKFYDYEDIVE